MAAQSAVAKVVDWADLLGCWLAGKLALRMVEKMVGRMAAYWVLLWVDE